MPFDVFQQVFSLSLASNLVFGYTGDEASLQEALRLGLERNLPLISPEWHVMWGPVVWKYKSDDKNTGPDNSWYVAFHPELEYEDGSRHPTFVIAVAGTPKDSLYVWFKENFAVNNVADFRAWVDNGIHNPPEKVPSNQIVPGNAYIAMGTANAVHLLLNTPAPPGSASEGKTLLEFIASVCAPDVRVITTGLSLGGALSPSLALALVRTGVLPADSALTYPIAGASPGNIFFTQLFSETLPPIKSSDVPYQGWNLNLVNTLDVVPQAWCTLKDVSPEQYLWRIPSIYGRPVVPLVRTTTLLASFWSSLSHVIYKPLPSQSFSFFAPPVPPSNIGEFIQILGAQHLEAYLQEVGVPLPTLEEDIVRGNGLVEKTEDEKRFEHPLINDFEWAREHPREAEEVGNEIERSEEGKALLDQAE